MKVVPIYLWLLFANYTTLLADAVFTDAGDDHLWSNPTNWLNGFIPNSQQDGNGASLWSDGLDLQIETNIAASCRGFMLGMYGSTNSATVSGGSLDCQWLDIGRANQNGGNGTLTVSGGSVIVNGLLSIPNQFNTLTDSNNLGRGRLDLIGGNLRAQNLHMGSRSAGKDGGIGELFITEGILRLQNNQVNKLQGYLDAGYIMTDSYRDFILEYDASSNFTELRTEIVGNLVDIEFTGIGLDDLWSNPENWMSQQIPDSYLTGAEFLNDGLKVIINQGIDAKCRGFMLGMYGATNTAEILGGSLSCQWLDIGRSDSNGGSGTLTISGGIVSINEDLSIPNQFNTQIDPENLGNGRLELLGGVINAKNLLIGNGQTGIGGGTGIVYITDGVLNLEGNRVFQIIDYINQGYIYTKAFRSLSYAYNASTNLTTVSTVSSFSGIPDNPYPDDTGTYSNQIEDLYWSAVEGADSYKVYFGVSDNPSLVATYDSSVTNHSLPAIVANQKYYWKVEAIRGNEVNTGPLWEFTVGDLTNDPMKPPFTDYCAYLSQEIQGKKHGFLAGNRTYYVGGFHPSWQVQEHETIGFTHPYHHDLRSRGYGMVQNSETGYGHDYTGWEFYKYTKIAYGTVIIGNQRFENPVPVKMYWRPDRMICEYSVNGVQIREDKFIALNDVACTMITASEPVEIEFSGQSFYKDGVTVSTTASCNFVASQNLVRIDEGGVNLVVPDQSRNSVPGVMMYDGMSTILAASNPIQNFSVVTESTGQKKYSFKASCDESGLSLVWYMNDDYGVAAERALQTLENASSERTAKTNHMNSILNEQIPYFRCSDKTIIEVYYFLWAIYLMYNIDLSDESPDFYPHTQTAVNNFMGLHRFDANIQIPVGSWAVDKVKYANGNALRWKSLLGIANLNTGRIPADNIGKEWWSGLSGTVTGHAVGAWQIYEHSGDINFLAEAYGFYRVLMQNVVPGFWGQQYNAALCLSKMAQELDYDQSEINSWDTKVNYSNIHNWYNYALDEGRHGHENFFTFGNNAERKSWTTFGYMRTRDFPKDVARDIVETHAVDGPAGFLTNGLIAVASRDDWDLIEIPQSFFITPDTNYFSLMGMYATDLEEYANTFAIDHLKKYNYNEEWGVPCAPEGIGDDYEFFGDQYSNFNAGKILVILEGIFGLSYSVIDSQFTVADNLPTQWQYMESFVPIKEDGNEVEWVRVFVKRNEAGQNVRKKITVENNPLTTTNINPWLENKALIQPPAGYLYNSTDLGHLQYAYTGVEAATVEFDLTEEPLSDFFASGLSIHYDANQTLGKVNLEFTLPIAFDLQNLSLEKAASLEGSFSEVLRLSEYGEISHISDTIHSINNLNSFSVYDDDPNVNSFYRIKVNTK